MQSVPLRFQYCARAVKSIGAAARESVNSWETRTALITPPRKLMQRVRRTIASPNSWTWHPSPHPCKDHALGGSGGEEWRPIELERVLARSSVVCLNEVDVRRSFSDLPDEKFAR